MAGSMALVASKHAEKLATAIREGWEVEFSRFFSYPPMASTSPDLVPLPPHLRNRRPFGTWITSMSPAWLQLVRHSTASAVILTVFLAGKIQEEHYVSKLHFAWPQSSCISGFPARGTRAVIASYRDCMGEVQKFAFRFSTICETEAFLNAVKVQKFAFRFSTICETEAFLNAVKEILNGVNNIEPLSSEFGSAISSQSEFVSSDRPPYRATEDLRIMSPALTYTPELPASSNVEAAQQSCIQETAPTHNFSTNFAAFPPSFTSLLTSNCPIVEQAAANPTVSEENLFKSQLTQYLGDSSFHDMLIKVEKVINELGGDLTLTQVADVRNSNSSMAS
ncbi:hypothetical protein TorRG33x02_052570 [Trema orientale]|uniref:Poor homologous synapsis 1 PH domain-containing protein n=1 Tax=Trema orientale TaxID=63057 RepID=A0A2P5FML8_TREOI|nr:hypothetical protein TorRG33x02_052570 [Trema orientale]